jgi:putative phage-type endonuclease
MKCLEEIHPLPTHPSYFDAWAEDILDFWETMDLVPPELYTLLAWRKRLFELSFHGISEHVDSDSWQWLLTVEQMPQRTTDWYTQKINMVTASEISSLWKGPRARINLIAAKCTPPEPREKRLAITRAETNPMDWGVRYEPVVKMILEKDGAQIQELGRIQHRTVRGLAASPDGLYTAGPLKGSLVEIKCPVSRAIQNEIPFDYWCQMQIQMEVCGIDSCEYVEAKFKEDDADPQGYISLLLHTDDDTHEMKYVYHTEPGHQVGPDEPWICIETYSWSCTSIRRTIVKRDGAWFERMRPDIDLFWKEVADVREGRRVLEPAKRKVKVEEIVPVAYSFVDSD